jgi:hypothetical protein
MSPQMLGDHAGMPPTLPRIVVRPAEHFGKELRDEMGMVGIHAREEWTEQVVHAHALVERDGEPLEGGHPTGPLEQGRYVLAIHGQRSFHLVKATSRDVHHGEHGIAAPVA